FQAEDGIRDLIVTGVQTCALPIYRTGLDTLSFNSSMAPANVAQYWQDMIQPLASGDQYRIRRCTPGNAVNFTSDPVVAAYDLFRSEERRVGKECRSGRSQND